MNNDALATEAIEWFLKVERGEPTLEVLTAWQQWLEQAPEHRKEYEATQRTWQALDHVTPRVQPAPQRAAHKWIWGTALAASVAVALVAAQLLTTKDVYRTQVAEHRELVLPDHSRVQVGARSVIEIDFSSEQRRVRLVAGEAFFSVVKDATRPFIVDAGLSKVMVVGTAFNVRRYDNAVTVEVAEGRVRLEHATADLKQGQEASVDATGRVTALRTSTAANVATWRDGRHSYIDEPLSVVVADLNRYSTRPVSIDDSMLAGLRITTTFFNNDSQDWLHTLESAVPALAIVESAHEVRIVARE